MASTTANRKRVTRAITAPDPDDVPDELKNFYGPPELTAARGAGTSGQGVSLDFSTPAPGSARASVVMEKLFSINGKDYFIPKEFPPGIGIIYLDGVADDRDAALGRCLKTAIGARNWAELVAFVADTQGGGITKDQMAHLLNIVMKKVLGSIEADDGGNG